MDGNTDSEQLYHLHEVARATFVAEYKECLDNYNDSNTLHNCCILKPNEKMKWSLNNAAVLGSSILSLIRFGIMLIEDGGTEERFSEGSEERSALEQILNALDIEDDPNKTSLYYQHYKRLKGKACKRPNIPTRLGKRVVPANVTYVHLTVFIANYIMRREIRLDEIQYGFFGNRTTATGRRSTLPMKCFLGTTPVRANEEEVETSSLEAK